MPPARPDRLRRSVAAATDAAIDVLMRPRVRRARRWAVLVTVPVATLVASVVDLRSGALVIGARAALWLAITIVAWRVGGERGEAVLDLLMHPRARALVRAETDVVLAFPRVLWAALVTRPARALRYSAGDHLPVLALAFAPPVLVEGAIVHLLMPGDWLLVHVVAAIAHAYALVWLLSWGLGSRAYPHRLARNALVARNGPLYSARVPLDAVAGAVARRERAGTAMGVPEGVVVRDGTALLPSRGRVDVWLELDRPVLVRRPLGEPLAVTRIALASDDPGELVRSLTAVPAPAPADSGRTALSVLGGLDLAGGLGDALAPA